MDGIRQLVIGAIMKTRNFINSCKVDYYKNITINIFELFYFIAGMGLMVYGAYMSV